MKEQTKEALDRYAQTGGEVSGFIWHLITGNLFGVFQTADDENLRDLAEIVSYCWNKMPSACIGSAAKVHEWQRIGGVQGWVKASKDLQAQEIGS